MPPTAPTATPPIAVRREVAAPADPVAANAPAPDPDAAPIAGGAPRAARPDPFPDSVAAPIAGGPPRTARPDPFPDSERRRIPTVDPDGEGHPLDEVVLETGDRTPSAARRGTRALLEWGAVILGALAVALLIKTFLVQAYFIPSESMVPTLNIDDRVLVNKLSYRVGEIERGQVVVFHRPEGWDGDDEDLIKRVIATSGETITITDGQVYIGEQLLQEPYLPDGVTTGGFVDQEGCVDPTPTSCTIPEAHIFVMGDNRGRSHDSRFEGPIPESDVVGRAFVKVWPLGDVTGL